MEHNVEMKYEALINEDEKHKIFLTHLMKNSVDFLILADADLNIVYCSISFLNMIGKKYEDVKNCSLLGIYSRFANSELLSGLSDMLTVAVTQGEISRQDIVADIGNTGEERYYRIINTPMIDKNVSGVIVDWNDITDITIAKNKTEKAMENIARQSYIVQAINKSAALLLNVEPDTFNSALELSMEMIARAVNIDCVYFWKNEITDGKLYCYQLFEWSLEQTEFADGQKYIYDDVVPGWKEVLSKGDYINSFVRDLSKREQEHLTGITSILVVPVFLEDSFWGFIGFDYFTEERLFEKEEITILYSAGMMIANAFIRNDMIKNIRNTSLQLEAALKQATIASKSKSDFLAKMSHEIRTPMNAVIGIAQIQLQKENLPDEYADALVKIYNSGNVLLGIINDILDLSKIETGKMELDNVGYDVPSLLNDTVQLNIVRIGSKPLKLILDVDEKMPSRLIGDELRIKQILSNLLSNAIKYTEKGHVKLSVDYLQREGSTMLRFRVEDTGQGICYEDQEKLFFEYARFNANANRGTEGIGLGLPIVKKLVDMMDGEIGVESEIGKGSIFTVIIKQGYEECVPIGAELANMLRKFKFVGEKQSLKFDIIREYMPYGKVLIVDDVESNLYVAEGLMLPYGLKIDTANSGFAALEKVKKEKSYDIIFMDHMMPLMDGIETTNKLRELGHKNTIVALTANALVGNRDMFLQNGFDDFISKPIDIRDLNAVLNKFIRNKYPEEAKKYKNMNQRAKPKHAQPPDAVPRLMEIFKRDAVNAVETLRTASASGDLKAFTVSAHAMKSALANIGEDEKSAQAYELEMAGQKGDMDYILSNSEHFINMIEELAASIKTPEAADIDDADIHEDTAFLVEQLEIAKTACEEYDDTMAYTALDLLKSRSLKKATAAALDNIRDLLYLESDFDEAAQQLENMLNGYL